MKSSIERKGKGSGISGLRKEEKVWNKFHRECNRKMISGQVGGRVNRALVWNQDSLSSNLASRYLITV